MRQWIYCVLLLLTACASQPKAEQQTAFKKYWNCAYSAAAEHMTDNRLSARETAMRAQAHCYDFYLRYQTAQARYVRSVVTPEGYKMATALAGHEAVQRKEDVTNRLIQLIAQARE